MTLFSEWLRRIGLEHYAPVFVENDIDFEVIRSLTDDDLRQLGLSLGHRRKLQQALVALESQRAAAPTGTSFTVPTTAQCPSSAF